MGGVLSASQRVNTGLMLRVTRGRSKDPKKVPVTAGGLVGGGRPPVDPQPVLIFHSLPLLPFFFFSFLF